MVDGWQRDPMSAMGSCATFPVWSKARGNRTFAEPLSTWLAEVNIFIARSIPVHLDSWNGSARLHRKWRCIRRGNRLRRPLSHTVKQHSGGEGDLLVPVPNDLECLDVAGKENAARIATHRQDGPTPCIVAAVNELACWFTGGSLND